MCLIVMCSGDVQLTQFDFSRVRIASMLKKRNSWHDGAVVASAIMQLVQVRRTRILSPYPALQSGSFAMVRWGFHTFHTHHTFRHSDLGAD